MARYPDSDRPSPEQLCNAERFALDAISQTYRYTDHPGIWVPTLTLYAVYARHWNEYAGGRYAPHHFDEYGHPLTPAQFGTALGRIYPEHPRCNRSLGGRRYRGIEGLVGPGSVGCRGWDAYPMHTLEFPPDDWTPSPEHPTLVVAFGPED